MKNLLKLRNVRRVAQVFFFGLFLFLVIIADLRYLKGYPASLFLELDPLVAFATAITTQPHPGFPTDLQAQFMALLTIADGNSVITEKIFPDRFLHVAELSRLGARLHKEGATVVIQGQTRLVGAPVMASDLRASAALVIAGLAARGTTTVMRVYHIDRGYEKIEHRLNALGASIKRVNQEELEL